MRRFLVYGCKSEVVESYDLEDMQCPVCGEQVVGLFRNGKLVRTTACRNCLKHGGTIFCSTEKPKQVQ